MIAFLSPARNMQPGRLPAGKLTPLPYPEETRRLVGLLKDCPPWAFEHMLKLNPELAWEAFTRYQDLDLDRPGTAALQSTKCYAYRQPFRDIVEGNRE